MAVAAAPAAAQSWQTELGFQGGFVRIKPAGTNHNDQIDAFDLPGFNLGPALPTPAALYVILPVGDKIALEPSFTGAVLTQGGTATLMQVGLRGDYAITEHIYGAAGGLVGRLSGTNTGFELGLQLGAGFRFHLAGPLRARLEANVQTWKGRSGGVTPVDTYGLLFGIAARL